MTEPHIEVVTVPAIIQIHPRLLERYEKQRAELAELLTPEAMAALDQAEHEAARRFLEGK